MCQSKLCRARCNVGSVGIQCILLHYGISVYAQRLVCSICQVSDHQHDHIASACPLIIGDFLNLAHVVDSHKKICFYILLGNVFDSVHLDHAFDRLCARCIV